jgi:ABC-type antimicrobial peptide transport system permease subunit
LTQAWPRSSLWLAGTTIRRFRSQWRLISVVVAVAILATTLISSLGLLVTATEQGAIRVALSRIPAAQTDIDVQVLQSQMPVAGNMPVADTRSMISKAVKSVLGNAATATVTAMGVTDFIPVSATTTPPQYAYFGEFDNIRSNAELVSGAWAGKPTGSTIPVTVPVNAAEALGYSLGSTFLLSNDPKSATVTVVGIYRPKDAASSFWDNDPLVGEGSDPAHTLNSQGSSLVGVAFGPLIAAPGAMTRAGFFASLVDIHYRPHFVHTSVDQLAPLVHRLSNADTDVSLSLGDTAQEADYNSDVQAAVSGVASGLVVTRSTVVVVSLLLLVLALVAMGQTARLLTDSRSGERQLMRARGASAGNVIALTLVEAIVLGVITAAVSPLLANLVYRALAAQPAMVSAGMPGDAGLPALTWATAAGISLLFVIVLVVPLIRQGRTFVDAEQSRGRQRAASGLMRSGLDIGFVIIAAIAYWQLRSYHSPVSSTSVSIAVDPVLVAGPALVLLAGALLCLRLIPAAARILERVGLRTRGSVVPLAAWEIGRRSQRATSAVLLLSLALGVGSFGLSFLDTWRQSQVDQASLAVGPPVRVPAVDDTAIVQASQLSAGAIDSPQPVIRTSGQLTSTGQGQGNSSDGTTASILGLTPAARGMIDRGRLAGEGGSRVVSTINLKASPVSGIALPGAARGVSATIQIGTKALNNVAAKANAIIQDANGLLTTVSMGGADVDGKPHTVTGLLRPLGTLKGIAAPLQLVGIQVQFYEPNSGGDVGGNPATRSNVLVKDIAVLHASSGAGVTPVTYTAQQVKPNVTTRWHAVAADPNGTPATSPTAPVGWQFALGVTIPPDVKMASASFALVAWEPVSAMAGVITSEFASSFGFAVGDALTVSIGDVPVHIIVGGTAHLIPGTATSDVLSGGSAGLAASASQTDMVVVDQALLARTLVQSGMTGPEVSEWWVNVPPNHGQAYLDAHPATDARASDVLALQLQQAPLRVATQAALWLAILAGALLAAVGFVVHSTTTMRARRLELAQLRAIGLSRNKLVGLFAAESLLITVLGVVFGITIGLLLVWLVGPLVAVSPDGSPPVPSVVIEIPWPSTALLVLGLAAVLALVVLVVARVQRFVEPAELLRDGSEL